MIYSPGDLLLASSRGIKGEQPLHVPSHGHQAPLASDPIETAQQELPEAEHRFDDAEHRLRRLLAQGISFLPSGVISRCAMASTGVGFSGAGGTAAKRWFNEG